MPRIRCHYTDCVFLEDGLCGANSVEIDPDEGCMTYTHVADVAEDDEWDAEEFEGLWEEEDDLFEADVNEDDLWLEEETSRSDK